MALSSLERTSIIKLGVAMYNASVGAAYLPELGQIYEANGRSLSALATALAGTPAYLSLNPASQTPAQFAASFLTPLGLQSNQFAVDYVVQRLAAGASKGLIAVEAMLALSATTAAEFQDAKSILLNKTSVAEYHSVTQGVPQTDLASLRQAIGSVTKDASSISTARTAIDALIAASPISGQTYNLTATTDALTGTGGNDTFIGTAASVSAADVLDGGAGTDILKITGTNILPAISNIETVYFDTPDGNVDVSGAAGVRTLQIENAANHTFNLSADQNLSLSSARGVFGFNLIALPANDPSLDIMLNGTGNTQIALSVHGAALSALNIAGSGSPSVASLASPLNPTGLTSIKVAGNAQVTLETWANGLKNIASFDASANTAGVIWRSFILFPVRFTGSSGDDRIETTFINGNVVLDGGAGTDTLFVNNVDLTAVTGTMLATLNASRSFETLAFSGTSTNIDCGLITSDIKTFRVERPLTAVSAGFLNLTNAHVVELSSARSATVTLSNKGGQNTAQLKMSSDANFGPSSIAQLSLQGATSVLNIESTGTGPVGANAVVLKANADGTVFNLTGSNGLQLSGIQALEVGTTINGRAATGQLVMTGTTKTDLITGGSAGDLLFGGGGNDSLTGNAGADIFLLGGGDANAAGAANMVTITDFTPGVDKIGIRTGSDQLLTGLAVAGAHRVQVNATQVINSASDAAGIFAGVASIPASTSSVVQSALVVVTNGPARGTYLVVNDDVADISATADLLVKLMGTVNSLSSGDFASAAF